jgi:hypothetical protein
MMNDELKTTSLFVHRSSFCIHRSFVVQRSAFIVQPLADFGAR